MAASNKEPQGTSESLCSQMEKEAGPEVGFLDLWDVLQDRQQGYGTC